MLFSPNIQGRKPVATSQCAIYGCAKSCSQGNHLKQVFIINLFIYLFILQAEGFSAQWDRAERCMQTTKLINNFAFIFTTLLKISLGHKDLTGFCGVPFPSKFCWSDLGFSLAAYEMWGALQNDSSHYCDMWLSHRAAVQKLAYSHPACRILAPASHSESCTLRTDET